MEDEAKVRNELLAMIIAEDDEEVLKKLLVFVKKLIDEQEKQVDKECKHNNKLLASSEY